MGEFEDFLNRDQNNMGSGSFENQVSDQHLINLRNRAIGAVLFVGGGLDIIAALDTKWNFIFKGVAAIPAMGAMLLGFSLFRGHSQIFVGDRPTNDEFPPDDSI